MQKELANPDILFYFHAFSYVLLSFPILFRISYGHRVLKAPFFGPSGVRSILCDQNLQFVVYFNVGCMGRKIGRWSATGYSHYFSNKKHIPLTGPFNRIEYVDHMFSCCV